MRAQEPLRLIRRPGSPAGTSRFICAASSCVCQAKRPCAVPSPRGLFCIPRTLPRSFAARWRCLEAFLWPRGQHGDGEAARTHGGVCREHGGQMLGQSLLLFCSLFLLSAPSTVRAANGAGGPVAPPRGDFVLPSPGPRGTCPGPGTPRARRARGGCGLPADHEVSELAAAVPPWSAARRGRTAGEPCLLSRQMGVRGRESCFPLLLFIFQSRL